MVDVAEFSVPDVGTDIVEITLEETYEVEGIGTDTVTLKGTLVAERAVPLLDHGTVEVSWETSTVVARFVALSVTGESKVFGPVSVVLDTRSPAVGVVKAGDCKAAIAVIVSMSQHDLVLRTAEPMQLQSTVRTVPPIGDERTVSVRPIKLLDIRTQRPVGTLVSARVLWRDLTAQVAAG
ncbi:DUF6073 family protein [Lentzea sp. NPDC051213]|uniref:DUF6073 family protein n=1 Tax=Lentzea sp. NPDC051213 TaxID=3364126 RepID=UPI0037981E5B